MRTKILVLILSLTLTACGGGGGGGSNPSTNNPVTTTTTTSTTNTTIITVSGYTYFAGTTIPVSGVTVAIGSATYTTASDGTYTLSNVPSGTQTITATKTGYDSYSKQISVPTTGLTQNIEMTGGEVFSLSGYVKNSLGTALYGVTITVLNPDSSSSNLIDTTDATGHYQIPNVPQGTRNVKYNFSGYTDKTESIYIYNANKTYDVILSASAIDPPTNFVAVANSTSPSTVALTWTARTESTIKGYNIYRSTSSDSGYIKINTSLITTTYYTDSNHDTTYYYKISSVNIDNVEGNMSSYISTITASSRVISSFSSPDINPSGIEFDGTYLWIADWYSDKIYKINPSNGSVISSFASPGSHPTGLAFDGTYLWSVSSDGDTIYKINPANGSVISSFGTPVCCLSNSKSDHSSGLAYDGAYLWIADFLSDEIYKINPADGTVISSFPSPGSSPTGLAFDGTYLWNSDSATDKIYKLYITDLLAYNPIKNYLYAFKDVEQLNENYLLFSDFFNLAKSNTSKTFNNNNVIVPKKQIPKKSFIDKAKDFLLHTYKYILG